jgi:hypothetical protein
MNLSFAGESKQIEGACKEVSDEIIGFNCEKIARE